MKKYIAKIYGTAGKFFEVISAENEEEAQEEAMQSALDTVDVGAHLIEDPDIDHIFMRAGEDIARDFFGDEAVDEYLGQ